MNKDLLVVRNLSYSYGSFQALREISLNVLRSESVIITGPNGAGKTTLLLCLAGLLKPTTGNILVDGSALYKNEIAAKQQLAFVSDVPRFYQELTVWEHLKFISLAHNDYEGFEERAESLLAEFGLWEARNLFPHTLSRGMRLKLGIALSLIRPFSVLIMDEPTSSLDPDGTEMLKRKISELKEKGAAIIFTTHDLALMNDIAGRKARMYRGQLELN